MEDIEKWFQFGVMISAGLGGLIYGIHKVYKKWKDARLKKSDELFTQINLKIWEILTEIRIKGNASRVSITQFHNGGKYVDGSSMRRMSITHQSCDQKIPSTMQFRQDSLVSRFSELVEMLQDNDPVVRTVGELSDTNTRRFYNIHDTLAFSILPIQCSDSLTIHGYISVEWCDLGSLDKVDEMEFLASLENARTQIAFLLNSTKEYR